MIDVEARIREALKGKDAVGLTCWRAVKAKAEAKVKEAGREAGQALTEEEQLAILRKEIKERAEANEFRAESHPEFAVNRGVADILEAHLPQAPSAEEADALIARAIAEVNPAGPREMGKVMAALRQANPALDMAYASGKVKALLQERG